MTRYGNLRLHLQRTGRTRSTNHRTHGYPVGVHASACRFVALSFQGGAVAHCHHGAGRPGSAGSRGRRLSESRVYAEAGEMPSASTGSRNNQHGREKTERPAYPAPWGRPIGRADSLPSRQPIGSDPTDAEASQGLPRERGTLANTASSRWLIWFAHPGAGRA